MTEYPYIYRSPMRESFYAFLDYKTSVKQKTFHYAFLFKQFDTFLMRRKYERTYIDKEIYNEWLEERIAKVSPTTIYTENSNMHVFLVYITRMGNDCYIPPQRKRPERTYVPHVISHEELNALFVAIDGLRLKNRCTRNDLHAIPALIRMLYSTGIRLGEALNLRNKDVDMKCRVIKLCKTKNWRERIAPINDSLAVVLEEYLYYRNRIPAEGIGQPDGYFFCGAKGQKVPSNVVGFWFRTAVQDAGIPYYGRSEGGPNIHCLRHTACVHALLKMVKSGLDPYCCLPTLSTFMGHSDVTHTEYYLHLTEELYPEIIQLERKISSGVNEVINNAYKRYNDEEY